MILGLLAAAVAVEAVGWEECSPEESLSFLIKAVVVVVILALPLALHAVGHPQELQRLLAAGKTAQSGMTMIPSHLLCRPSLPEECSPLQENNKKN
jgi:fumarate reductase subunit D